MDTWHHHLQCMLRSAKDQCNEPFKSVASDSTHDEQKEWPQGNINGTFAPSSENSSKHTGHSHNTSISSNSNAQEKQFVKREKETALFIYSKEAQTLNSYQAPPVFLVYDFNPSKLVSSLCSSKSCSRLSGNQLQPIRTRNHPRRIRQNQFVEDRNRFFVIFERCQLRFRKKGFQGRISCSTRHQASILQSSRISFLVCWVVFFVFS